MSQVNQDEMCALYSALAKAQSGMGSLARDAKGNFGKYATLASVIEVVLPPLSEQGIAVIQMPETSADGVTLVTMLCHKNGGFIRNELTMKPTKNDPQGIGSTITYARRYALMAIAGVAPDDDDGTAGSASTEPRKNASQAKKDGSFDVFNAAINGTTLPMRAAEILSEAPHDTWPLAWQDSVKDKVIDVFRSSLIMAGGGEALDWIREHDKALLLLPIDWGEKLVQEAKDMRASWLKSQQEAS